MTWRVKPSGPPRCTFLHEAHVGQIDGVTGVTQHEDHGQREKPETPASNLARCSWSWLALTYPILPSSTEFPARH